MVEATLSVQLLTPERALYAGEAQGVILRTPEGDITFLASHTPLVGAVVPGLVRVHLGGGDELRAAAHGGFVEVGRITAEDGSRSGTLVTILLGVAELSTEIDAPRAHYALGKAEARLAALGAAPAGRPAGAEPGAEADVTAIERADVENAIARANLRLELAGEPSHLTAATAGEK